MKYAIEQVHELDQVFYVYKTNEKSVYLNSNFSMEKEMEKFAKNIKKDRFNILIGVGNGAVIEKLSTNTGVHSLIIEPFKDVELSKEAENLIKENSNISFFYNEDISPLIINSYIKRFSGIETNILIHPRYEKTDRELLSKIVKSIKDATVMLQVNINTERFFQKDWVIEPILNLPYTTKIPPINELEGKFVGETAFLVASGPSLKENMEFLKNNSNKAYIFAAGSAINGLLSNDVEPDFVSVIDSSEVNYTAHFQDSRYSGPLIISGMVNSKIVENHNGPLLLADLNIDPITSRYCNAVQTFPSVPSVAVFTLQILYYLGFSKVYLIGQDLALLGGEYYAKGVKVHQKSNHFDSQLYVESNNGEQVGTLYSLYSHLQSFNDLIKLLDSDKMKIYNLSENGAKIDGAPFISPQEVEINKLKSNIHYQGEMVYDITDKKITEIIKEIEKTEKEVFELLEKLNKFNLKAINFDDLKRVLKLFKKVRELDLVENVLLNQLSFYVQQINNKFEYTFEKNTISNDDRVVMVKQIINLLEIIHGYILSILDDKRIQTYREQKKY